jgi:hypothetical protein
MMRRKVDVNPFNSITSILFMVLVFVALYWLATGIFKLLSFAAPFLLVAALIINHKVVINYGKWLWNLLKTKPLMGIGGVLLSIFGFPIIAGFLFGKALLFRKVDKMKTEFETKKYGEFVDYEEVDEEPQIRLELPEYEKPKPKKNQTDYDQYFE